MLISVIIPLYNKSKWIKRAIESVLSQDYQNFELIVIDDGSTDGGGCIVEGIKDVRIRLIDQPNAGVSAARNTGIKNAKGQWIGFLDADDVWLPNNLASHIKLIQRHPELKWTGGSYREINSKNEAKETKLQEDFIGQLKDGVIPDILNFIDREYICTITLLISRDVFEEVGFFDSSLRTAEDLDLWLRIGIRYPSMGYNVDATADYYIDTDASLTKIIFPKLADSSPLRFCEKYSKLSNEISHDRRSGILRLCRRKFKSEIAIYALAGKYYCLLRYRKSICQALGRVNWMKYMIGSLVCKCKPVRRYVRWYLAKK